MTNPNLTDRDADPHSTLATITAAALLLTFLQLLTAWFENIYRMSLIKLEMGPELAGLLLPLLAPLAAWGMCRAPRLATRLAVLAYMILYVLVWYPPTTPVQTILLAGTGAALALALAAHALSGPHGPRIDGFTTAALATLAYATLRAAGNSLDLYAAGSLIGLLPLVVLLPLFALHGASNATKIDVPARGSALLPVLMLFGAITAIYLVLSTPAAMAAWQGDSDTLAPPMLALALALTSLYGVRSKGPVSNAACLLLNIAFFAFLIAAILLSRVNFPDIAGGIVTVAPPSTASLLVMLSSWALAPAIALSVGAVLPLIAGRSAIALVCSLLAGLYVLVFVALLLVFTNVWGYVGPLGAMMRNQFVMPFMLCAASLLIPMLLLRNRLTLVPLPGTVLRRLIAVLALVLVSVDSQRHYDISIPTPDPNTFTVLTYNFQQGSRDDGDQAYVAQCDFIRRVNPDVVALQESDTARPSGGFVNAAQYFAKSLGYYYYYGPSTIAGTFGTAILSRFPMRSERTIYTYSDEDEVGTAAVDLKIGNKLVAFYNNHPAGSDTVMDAHADMLMNEIQRGGPVIAAGDFNSRPNEAPYKALNAVLHNAWETLHPDNKGPGFSLEKMAPEGEIDMTRRIDHIFYSADLEVISAHYVLPPDSQTDHPAHWAVLKFKNR